MLTEPGDVVADIFAGSNTTGEVAEAESRRWLAFEALPDYVANSSFRFLDKSATPEAMRELHDKIVKGETIDLTEYRKQIALDV